MVHDPNARRAHAILRPEDWPAKGLAFAGLLALVVCLALAIWRGPADADITDAGCEAAVAVEQDRLKKTDDEAVGIDVANDRMGVLRIGSVAPGEIAIGGHLCAIVTGVISDAKEKEAVLGVTGLATVQITGDSAKDRTSKGFFRDILSANGAPQLQRIQAVAWTLILGAIFVWTVFRDYRFPVFDDMLLLPTGLVNSLYIGFKFEEKKPGRPDRARTPDR